MPLMCQISVKMRRVQKLNNVRNILTRISWTNSNTFRNW